MSLKLALSDPEVCEICFNHMTKSFLIYGANGFVGSETARLAVRSGYKPILAGRNREALKGLANELGMEYRVFGLDDPQRLEKELGDVPLVLHCAGPYIFTSKPMVDACLKIGTHYLDITGAGPAGLPPGTQRTMFEMIPYGFQMRHEGNLVTPSGK